MASRIRTLFSEKKILRKHLQAIVNHYWEMLRDIFLILDTSFPLANVAISRKGWFLQFFSLFLLRSRKKRQRNLLKCLEWENRIFVEKSSEVASWFLPATIDNAIKGCNRDVFIFSDRMHRGSTINFWLWHPNMYVCNFCYTLPYIYIIYRNRDWNYVQEVVHQSRIKPGCTQRR